MEAPSLEPAIFPNAEILNYIIETLSREIRILVNGDDIT